MPPTFPCPNPVCTQVFNADAVQGASSLVCPRCGTKFEFRSQTPAKAPAVQPKAAAPKPPAAPTKPAAPPAKPAAKPPLPTARVAAPPPVPMAKPVAAAARVAPPPLPAKPAAAPPPLPTVPLAAPAVPMAMPLAGGPAASSALAFNSTPDVVLAPRRRRSLPGWLVATLIIVLVFGGMAAFVIYFIYLGYSPWNNATPGTVLTEEQTKGFIQQGNFSINPPLAPWKQDAGLQVQMHVDLAYRRTGPSSAMALAFKDYQKRLPRDAELIDEALGKLHTYLGNVEYEVKPRGEDVKLAGQPALAMEFTGEDPEHVLVEGECLMMASRGFGYWYFAWGPQEEHDNLTGQWTTLRQGISLGKLREGWTEAPRPTLPLVGAKLPYKMDYADEIWRKEELDGYDPHADAVLMGYDPKDKEGRRGDMVAVVQVLGLDKAADLAAAVKEAREHLLEMEKEKQADADQYNFPRATMEVTTDKSLPNADNDARVGGFQGHVTKFQVKKSPDHQKYVVLAVVRADENVLAVVCECAWERRDYWEQEFTPLLDKLRPAKGK